LVLAEWGYSGERVTDAMLQEAFGRSHSVMKSQRERIHALIDGFLMGDAIAIERYAEDIGQDMTEVGRSFPPDPGQQAEIWKTMSELVEASRQLRTSAREGNHEEAYSQFAIMMSRCILCHQQRRTWGKFLEPPPSEGPSSSESGSDDVQTSIEYE
jgi:hypothetical protein